jgi:toxin ParE1/3/4
MAPVIYKAARQRLGEIWDYTVEKWDEEEADRYLQKLNGCIQSLQNQRHTWRRVRDRRLPDVFFARCEHHVIFFREVGGQIAVISILHENMDMLVRLREDSDREP